MNKQLRETLLDKDEAIYLQGSATHLPLLGQPAVNGHAVLTGARFLFTGQTPSGTAATVSLPLESWLRVYEMRGDASNPLLVIDTTSGLGKTFRLEHHDQWLNLMRDPVALMARDCMRD